MLPNKGNKLSKCEEEGDDALYSLIFENEFIWESSGKLIFYFSNVCEILPDIEIDMNKQQVYRSSRGLYFKWKITSPLDQVLKLISKGMDFLGIDFEFPDVVGLEFDVALTTNILEFRCKTSILDVECRIAFDNRKDPIHCKIQDKFFAVIGKFFEDLFNEIGEAVEFIGKVLNEKMEEVSKFAEAAWVKTSNMIGDTGKTIGKGFNRIAGVINGDTSIEDAGCDYMTFGQGTEGCKDLLGNIGEGFKSLG